MEEFIRTKMIIGADGIDKLRSARVAVFGIGGVGSFVAEALARAGVGTFVLTDSDTVAASNINRQLIALHSTIGRKKVDVMRDRILDINESANIIANDVFYIQENCDCIDYTQLDYVVDAIDTVSSKLIIIEKCAAFGVPIISSMGTGNKLYPSKFKIADVFSTSVCPLARVMRHELKKRGIKELKVLYSEEEPIKPIDLCECNDQTRRRTPGSISFVPSVAGFLIAGEVIRNIIGKQ